MKRIAMGIQYHGQAYHGWQMQDETDQTVQGQLELALSKVANEPIRVHCAGRTDTGVHALGQVVHFDTNTTREERAWVFGANRFLPKDISVIWMKEVDAAFHARFSAIARSYRYLIYNQNVRSPLWRSLALHYPKPLDHSFMQQGANYLVGQHDFTSFRSRACQAKHPMRTILSIDVTKQHGLLTIDITANAFLHNMVRNIMGVLLEVGTKERDPKWVQEVLQRQDRTKAGVTAPAHGLYFVKVAY